MNSVQTDNSHFEVKIKLRVDNLPKGPCRVLDCFAGNSRIWNAIKKRHPEKHIDVLQIERKKDRHGVYLVGDNSKFLPSLSLDQFNVIDLDSYGVPYKQLSWLFTAVHGNPKTIFVTFIQSVYGKLPTGLLADLSYSASMVAKCPTLFNSKGFEKLKLYLALNGVEQIRHYRDYTGRKHYLCFILTTKEKGVKSKKQVDSR